MAYAYFFERITPTVLICILAYINWINGKRITVLEEKVKDQEIDNIGKE